MYVIEQEPHQVQAAFALNTNASLIALRLASARIESIQYRHAKTDVFYPELSFRTEGVTREEQNLTLGLEFEFKLRDGSEEGQELVNLVCSFEAEYELRAEFQPTAEQVSAFHAGNAIFNCWPFFREFVQNTAVRLTYPPPPIPFLRLVPKRDNSGDIDADPAAEHVKSTPKAKRSGRAKRTT